MKFNRIFSVFLVILCCFVFIPIISAEENTDSGSKTSNPLMDGLMTILQQSIDEFIGSYKGSLGEVRLLERRGNKVVLEVTYDNVKRSDNVYVQGEVRQSGTKLEGFSNTLSSVSGSHGKATLVIGWTSQGDDGWGTSVSEVKSDQIRLFLVRSSNPDRPFGEIIYDMSKIWKDSDESDEESMTADNGAIELEDGEAASGNKPAPTIFIKPGTVLKPYTPVGTAQIPGQDTNQGIVQTSPPSSQTKPPVLATPLVQNKYTVQQYEFYDNAKAAKWISGAGPLPFPGAANDAKGFVRCLPNGTLNSGNAAINLLQTHPEWKNGGWIEGQFPLMILGDNLHFKSVVGFLKGANLSDGAVFQVYVKENNKYYRAASSRVEAKKYMTIDADLSTWAGKTVQIVLRVRSGNTSDQDWAVWVKPRLAK